MQSLMQSLMQMGRPIVEFFLHAAPTLAQAVGGPAADEGEEGRALLLAAAALHCWSADTSADLALSAAACCPLGGPTQSPPSAALSGGSGVLSRSAPCLVGAGGALTALTPAAAAAFHLFRCSPAFVAGRTLSVASVARALLAGPERVRPVSAQLLAFYASLIHTNERVRPAYPDLSVLAAVWADPTEHLREAAHALLGAAPREAIAPLAIAAPPPSLKPLPGYVFNLPRVPGGPAPAGAGYPGSPARPHAGGSSSQPGSPGWTLAAQGASSPAAPTAGGTPTKFDLSSGVPASTQPLHFSSSASSLLSRPPSPSPGPGPGPSSGPSPSPSPATGSAAGARNAAGGGASNARGHSRSLSASSSFAEALGGGGGGGGIVLGELGVVTVAAACVAWQQAPEGLPRRVVSALCALLQRQSQAGAAAALLLADGCSRVWWIAADGAGREARSLPHQTLPNSEGKPEIRKEEENVSAFSAAFPSFLLA